MRSANAGSMSALTQMRLTGKPLPCQRPRCAYSWPWRLSGAGTQTGSTGTSARSSARIACRATSPTPNSEFRYPTTLTPGGPAGSGVSAGWAGAGRGGGAACVTAPLDGRSATGTSPSP